MRNKRTVQLTIYFGGVVSNLMALLAEIYAFTFSFEFNF